MTLVTFLLALGAAFRLTRLLVEDTIAEPIHAFLARKASPKISIELGGPDHTTKTRVSAWFHDLISCYWCAGFWIASATTLAAAQLGSSDWFLYPAAALSLSSLIGIIATVLPD
jgi:hypothetical protein